MARGYRSARRCYVLSNLSKIIPNLNKRENKEEDSSTSGGQPKKPSTCVHMLNQIKIRKPRIGNKH